MEAAGRELGINHKTVRSSIDKGNTVCDGKYKFVRLAGNEKPKA